MALTNGVIVTASLSRELFRATGWVARGRNLALSSGLANVLLTPFVRCHVSRGWWVIGVTVLAILTINPALGLLLGWSTELVRAAIVRRLISQR